MLANSKAFSGFAVDDLKQAQEFYGDVLGLRVSVTDEDYGLMTLHLAGNRDTLGYFPEAGSHAGGLHHPQLPGRRRPQGSR